jgi:all-trans-retinol 13,14-reductase
MRTVIIGSGISGLTLGILLQEEGHHVTIVEQHTRPGGYLQSFRRGKAWFTVGLHLVGGCRPGEVLDTYLRLLGVRDRLDVSSRDDAIAIHAGPGQDWFFLPRGWETLRRRLTERCPDEESGIRELIRALRGISQAFPDFALTSGDGDPELRSRALQTSVREFIDGYLRDPELRRILGSFAFTSTLPPEVCPVSYFACVLDSFCQSVCRIRGGPGGLIDSLVDRFHSLGGTILLGLAADRVEGEKRLARSITLSDGTSLSADLFVSTTHPREAARLLEPQHLRSRTTEHLRGLSESRGAIKLYAMLDEPADELEGRHVMLEDGKGRPVYFSSATSGRGGQHTLEILSWVDFKTVEEWDGDLSYHQNAAYRAFKRARGQELLATVGKHFPSLPRKVTRFEVSTPLTNRSYTRSHLGSAGGVALTTTQHGVDRVRHRDKLKNFLFAGQSLATPGILGCIIHHVRLAGSILTETDLRSRVLDARYPRNRAE